MAASESSKLKIQQMYVAYYGRPGDPAGIEFWGEVLDVAEAGGGSIDSIISAFGNSDEYTNGIGSGTTAEQVTTLYQQMFNRDPESAGLDFWVNEIDSGARTLGEVALAIAESAQNDDATTLSNKVEAAKYYTEQLSATGAAYDSTHIADAQAMLKNVSSDPVSVVGSKVVTDGLMTAQGGTGGGSGATTFNLTTAADLITGTSGDDSISGLVGTNAQTGGLADTMQSVDIIDGGDGTDTLNVQTQSTTAIGAKITNVENILYKGFAANGMNFSNVMGTTSLTNDGSINTATFTNIGNLLDVTVKDVNATNTTINYSTSATSGLTDDQKLTLDSATNNANIDFSGDAIETLSVTTTGGASKVTLDNVNTITTLNVAGDQALTSAFAGTAVAALKTVDGSTATGNLKLDLATNVTASTMSVKTGTGDDSVTFANLTKDDTFDLGDGTDTLSINMAGTSVTTGPTFTNVEKINLTATANVSLKLDKAASLTDIGISQGTDTITVTKVPATAVNVNFMGDGTTAAEALDGLTYSLATSSGTSDSLNIGFSNVNASGANVTKDKDAITTVTAFTANGIETISINTADMGPDDTAVSGVSGGVLFTTFATDKLQTLNITSETLVDLDATATAATVNKIDGSAANGGVFLDLSAAADGSTTTFTSKALSVTLGDGADKITTLGADVNTTTISLGGGADTLTMHASDFGSGDTTSVNTITIDAGTGKDSIDVSASTTLVAEGTISITTGDGIDTVKIDGDGANQTGITITDFTLGSGGDKLDLTTSVANGMTGNTKMTTVTAGATLDNGFNVISQALGVSNSLSTTDVATMLATAAVVDNNTAADQNYIMVTDGTDAGIYEFTDAAGTTAIAAGELTLLVTLSGVDTTSSMTVDNLVDFLA